MHRLIAAGLVAAAGLLLFTADANARVVCRVYTEGNQRVTEFCSDGYLCDLEARKCRPGPEARRKMEADKARRLAEAKRRQNELRARLRNALKASRRVEPRRPAQQNVFNCSYKPAGGGAAWDAMCLDTVMSDPRRLAALRCNPGEICPRGAGGVVIADTRRPAQQTTYRAGTYTPGTWYTPSDDWRRVPSPQYHQTKAPAAQPPAAARPKQSLRERLRMRLRNGEAESQINKLIAERDKHARNTAVWNAMNEALKNLDQTLSDNGYDLSSTFKSHGVYGGGDQDGGGNAGGGGAGAGGDNAASDTTPPAQPPAADVGTPAPDQPAAKPEPDKPRLSSRDEIMCNFILYRVHQNDLAYRRLDQIPEQCRTSEMREALEEQQRQHPTIIFDSSDREVIRQMIGEVDALRDQAPPSE